MTPSRGSHDAATPPRPPPTSTALAAEGARAETGRTLLVLALLGGVLGAHVAAQAARAGEPTDAPSPAAAWEDRPIEPLTPGGRRALLDAYAPVVLLAPDEHHLPALVEWYLARSRLERPASQVMTASLAQPARVARLRPVPAAYGGSPAPADWAVYGHAYRAADGGVLLQYWFFYAYNSFLGLGDHEADWEHLTVRIGPAGRPMGAWYARHDENAPGVWVDWDRIQREGIHPVLLSARGSHASYAHAGEARWPERTCPTTRVAGAPQRGCRVWRTWDGSTGGVVDLGTRREPGTRFLLWPGRWGADGGITDLEGGPPGPAFQPGWCTDGDPDCS